MTREEIAANEAGRTAITRAQKWTLTAGFLLLIYSVPVLQQTQELAAYATGKRKEPWPHAYDIFASAYGAFQKVVISRSTLVEGVFEANGFLLDEMNRYERALEDQSTLTRAILPPAQLFLIGAVGAGNEQAYPGRDGWLFYRPGIDYLTGPGFLEPRQLEARSQAAAGEVIQPDPVKAIIEFHQQLAARGISLVVMPAPIKAMVHPEKFSSRYSPDAGPLRNPSDREFHSRLEAAGVLVFDPAEELAARKRESAQFLATDTHWTPGAMERCAELLAMLLKEQGLVEGVARSGFSREARDVTALGDIAVMLKLPENQRMFARETVTVRRVRTAGGDPWKPEPDAGILLLGDSFSNIYSLEAMGWGEAAGFAEQLSFFLDAPVDTMIRNDAGAHATRQMLSTELGRGNDRLAGKTVVVWQFAARELAVGNWKLLPMELRAPETDGAPGDFFSPGEGRTVTVTAKVVEASAVPAPGSVPYKDHIRSLHLTGIESEHAEARGKQALVYVWSMRDNRLTPLAAIRAGQRVTLRLRSWAGVEENLGSINRSEIGDIEVQLEEPAWGEPPE